MIARTMLLLGAMMMTGTTVYAYQPNWPPYMAPKKPTAEQVKLNYWNKLVALRGEVIAIQEQDGGALTEAHRADLQAKLDRINADLRREIRNNDAFSVAADGSRRQ